MRMVNKKILSGSFLIALLFSGCTDTALDAVNDSGNDIDTTVIDTTDIDTTIIDTVVYSESVWKLDSLGSTPYTNFRDIIFSDNQNGLIFNSSVQQGDPYIYATVDGGALWQGVSTDISAKDYSNAVIFTAEHYVVRRGEQVWETLDGGSTFNQMSYINESGDSVLTYDLDNNGVFSIAKSTSGKLIAVVEGLGTDSLFVYTVNPDNCNVESKLPVDGIQIKGGIFPQIILNGNTGIIYNMTDRSGAGSYLLSGDGGLTWEIKATDIYANYTGDSDNKTQVVYNHFFLDGKTGWLVGGSDGVSLRGFISKTVDGGETWQNISVRDNTSPFYRAAVQDIFFVDENEGFLILKSMSEDVLQIYQSLDGGAKWLPVKGTEVGDKYLSSLYITDSKGWAVGTNNLMYTLQR